MKTSKIIFVSFVVVAMGYSLIKTKINSHEGMSDLMLANIEALARNEGSDCDYKNGYTAFTNKSGEPMIVVKYGCQKPLIQVKGIVGSD